MNGPDVARMRNLPITSQAENWQSVSDKGRGTSFELVVRIASQMLKPHRPRQSRSN